MPENQYPGWNQSPWVENLTPSNEGPPESVEVPTLRRNHMYEIYNRFDTGRIEEMHYTTNARCHFSACDPCAARIFILIERDAYERERDHSATAELFFPRSFFRGQRIDAIFVNDLMTQPTPPPPKPIKPDRRTRFAGRLP